MNIDNSKKGFTLYMIVIMITVLLAVVLGLSTSIIGGINLVITLGDSVRSFYAADAGVEKALYNISNGNCDSFTGDFGSNYAGNYSVTIQYLNTCTSGGTVVVSTGRYNNATKRIEASY